MPAVLELLNNKRDIHAVQAHVTVLDATRVMNEHSVGAVVVTDQGRIVGIFTERDVLRRVVAEERVPSEVCVADVMTHEVLCCAPETTVDEARSVMKHRRVRHLPVVDDDGHVLGMISIGDLNAYQTNDQEQTIHYLHEYMYGRM